MKKSLLVTLVLAGCATSNPGFTTSMGAAQLKDAPTSYLCWDAYTGRIGKSAMTELQGRKIDCTPVVKEVYSNVVKIAPAPALCQSEIYNVRDFTSPIVSAEVKKRGLDCNQVMQAEFARQGAIAAQDSARAQRAAAFAAISNAYRPTYNPPTNTTCSAMGSFVNCRSY